MPVNAPQIDIDITILFDALPSGDPRPVALAFLAPDGPRTALLRGLLESPLDDPVAAVFALIWQDIGPDMSPERMDLLKWYIAAESQTRLLARHRALVAILTRLTGGPALPLTEQGCDLGFVAVRAAVECGPLALRPAAEGFLQRLASVWTTPDSPPPRPAMLLAAIQTVNLPVLRSFFDLLPDSPLPADLQRCVDWATGLFIEFAGIDPWLSGAIERQWQRDPLHPSAAQRKAQLGLHLGQPFATFAPLFHSIRSDPRDLSLKPALQFAYWRAANDNLDAEIDFLSGQLRALDPGWTEGTAPPPTEAPAEPGTPLPLDDLAALADHAMHLTAVNLDHSGPFPPATLQAEFDRLAAAIARAPVPAGWAVPNILQAAQRLVQIDRREVAWITHFVDAPHAQGQPHYGTVNLALFPVLHAGLMSVISALCQVGLDWVLAGNPSHGNAPIARLAQLHTRASLDNDQTDTAEGFLNRVAEIGILAEVVAILRDDCRLQRGDIASLSSLPPENRRGSMALPFQDHGPWSQAEAVPWRITATDPAVHGHFGLIWPDGQHQVLAHATPPGRIATAHLPGLRLVHEDLLIGPRGHVLRPDTYHTSAEFPWDSSVVIASRKRALRLRPSTTAVCTEPVLLLQAFEALRWRNYYHWIIPILSRVTLAQAQGLLDNRRLVVPDGLSGWMTNTLTLIGLPAERLLVVPRGQETRFADALLMSSIEHVSGAAVQSLRDRLLGATSDDEPPHRALFLSRATQKLRKLHNESEIEALARAMGFEVISPQDHSVAEQVRLFRQARGIAAVEGAALTNSVFSPVGTRVLAMLCVNDMMPIFNDLSIVLGHHHRKLAGRGLTGAASANRFQPPFSIDLDLARQSLTWVLEG